MTKTYRELTGKEKRQIKKLVVSKCANYDKEYGCLPLDCECYMFGVCYSCSGLCSYFRKAVLPEDKKLQAVFEPMALAVCKECGKHFQRNGKRAYCSDKCAAEARRKQTAARVRKHREQKRK